MLASNYSLQCFISPIIVSPDFFLLALSLLMITTPTFKELNEFSLFLSCREGGQQRNENYSVVCRCVTLKIIFGH